MRSILLDSWLARQILHIIPEFVDECLYNALYQMNLFLEKYWFIHQVSICS